MTDLKHRMAKGAAWLILFKLVERGIGFISTLILARILVPADFGLVAMATSVLAGLELLGAFSFDMALIQNRNAARRHYDTAWSFGLAFGVFKALLMCALAIPAAAFFSEPRLEGVMYALALCTAIQGAENIGIVAFQKDLEFHKEFWLGLARKLAGFVTTITLAYLLESYWALIAGVFAMRITSVVLSYTMHPYRPRWSWQAAGELFNYSKWLLLNNALIFLNNRGTDFIIGRFSGARSLGLYSVAYELANLPTTELVHPISRAVFPGYAQMAHDLPQLRQAFLQVIGLVALLTIPAGLMIGLLAEPVVRVLLGVKWLDAVPMIQALAVFGVVRSLHGPTGSIYLALGRPRFIAVLQLIQLVVAASLMFWLVPSQGAVGAAWALLIGASTAMLINYVVILRDLHLQLTQLVAVLWRPLAGAVAMGVALFLVEPWRPLAAGAGQQLLLLLLLGSMCTLAYLGAVILGWIGAGKPDSAESQILRFATRRREAPPPAPAAP